MSRRLFLALAGALVLLRVPSIAQPMGADQGLYAYVGDRILAGELPYRDAWDQKPPAIHYTYAVMRAAWRGDTSVGGADLLAAAAVGWLLFRFGAASGSPSAGAFAALVFLLLSNPAFTRLGGIRLRAQCETFISVAVAGAFLLLANRRSRDTRWTVVSAGVLFGVAFVFKYNAGIYAAAGLATVWLWDRLTWRDIVRLAAGFAVPVALMLGIFAAGGALRDLYEATITYNVRYSGETYAGPGAVVRYLMTFPIERARVDALWTVGGAGCLLLVALAPWKRARLVPAIWVGAACLSIAVNGSRGLPQYFVQANPALAVAAVWGALETWPVVRAWSGRRARLVGAIALLVVAVGVWRVNQFPKLFEQTRFDLAYMLGRIDRSEYLSRYADDRKYSAAASAELVDLVRTNSRPDDRIYIFGFTCAVYVDAERASASRFFWSRPVIVGFNAGTPGYGVEGLLAELDRRRPALVALQRRDWAPDVTDSAEFFMNTPVLANWLRTNYVTSAGPAAFDVWVRRTGS
jgi:hypothetical protein